MSRRYSIALVVVLTGALALPASAAKRKHTRPHKHQSPQIEQAARAPAPQLTGPTGKVNVKIEDIIARPLPGKVALRSPDGAAPIVIPAPKGRGEGRCPVGKYQADIYVYDHGVPYLVDAKNITVTDSKSASVVEKLALGISGQMPLQAFDHDYDLALDQVEEKLGTNPHDPDSVPNKQTLNFPAPVLSKKSGWYRGELQAHSRYNHVPVNGTESVAQLVRRAEKAKLDFLAITDRNTLAACSDPGFKSDKVVLIPAMEWGSEKEGVALIYGMRTFPDIVHTRAEAQAVLRLVQAQGGIFAIAHPCFPTAPWRWGLQYVNAVEVWCRGWRDVPPMHLNQLSAASKIQDQHGYVYSIAAAAQIDKLSANGQAMVFWDNEVAHHLRACVIGGSNTASPKVPIAHPITYVYAREKSWPAILDGIRLGRTYVSSGINGPTIQFGADLGKNGKIDLGMGGVAPLGIKTELQIIVTRAKGKKIEVLRNGQPIIVQKIKDNGFIMKFAQKPLEYSAYRVQIISKPTSQGFGDTNVLAISSPIYFENLIIVPRGLDPDRAWIKLPSKYEQEFRPDMFVPPSNIRTLKPKYLN